MNVVKKRILVVDDDPGICKGLRRLLESEGTYETREAHDNETALKEIASFSPQLIILDVKMPDTGGYGLCLKIKETPEYSHIKIIGMSGISGGIGKEFMAVLGADYYFEKPFDEEKFKKKVAALLEEKTQES